MMLMLKTEHRLELEKYLTDMICNDADDMIDFLRVRDDLEFNVGEKLSHLSDDDLWDVQLDYMGYDSIEDAMAEIEDDGDA